MTLQWLQVQQLVAEALRRLLGQLEVALLQVSQVRVVVQVQVVQEDRVLVVQVLGQVIGLVVLGLVALGVVVRLDCLRPPRAQWSSPRIVVPPWRWALLGCLGTLL
jgi:hypothetical protein